MDLYRIIRELVQERERLERIIQSLENGTPPGKTPAVRKKKQPAGPKVKHGSSTDDPAKPEVSERMEHQRAANGAEATE